MHELGIVFHVIKSVEEIAQENELTKVSAVTLSIFLPKVQALDYITSGKLLEVSALDRHLP